MSKEGLQLENEGDNQQITVAGRVAAPLSDPSKTSDGKNFKSHKKLDSLEIQKATKKSEDPYNSVDSTTLFTPPQPPKTRPSSADAPKPTETSLAPRPPTSTPPLSIAPPTSTPPASTVLVSSYSPQNTQVAQRPTHPQVPSYTTPAPGYEDPSAKSEHKLIIFATALIITTIISVGVILYFVNRPKTELAETPPPEEVVTEVVEQKREYAPVPPDLNGRLNQLTTIEGRVLRLTRINAKSVMFVMNPDDFGGQRVGCVLPRGKDNILPLIKRYRRKNVLAAGHLKGNYLKLNDVDYILDLRNIKDITVTKAEK